MAALLVVAIGHAMTPPRALPCEKIHPFHSHRYFCVVTLEGKIAGSGDIKTGKLAANNVKVSIAGSGDAKVWAKDTLKISVAGSGYVAYYGDAKVSQSVVGSGSVKRLGSVPAGI